MTMYSKDLSRVPEWSKVSCARKKANLQACTRFADLAASPSANKRSGVGSTSPYIEATACLNGSDSLFLTTLVRVASGPLSDAHWR